MSSVVISGDTSGAVTVAAPAVSGTNTLTLQAATATSAVNTLATAVASTSGTSIDFTSLPAWVKKITVMFQGISTSGTSNIQIQLGDSGGIENTGYVSTGCTSTTGGLPAASTNTTGFPIESSVSASAVTRAGVMIISLMGSNLWVYSFAGSSSHPAGLTGGGAKTLSDTLDRVRITTVNGTDTFDAGSVNILYEG